MMYDILSRKYFVARDDSARRPTQHSLYPVFTLAAITPTQVKLGPCGGKMRTTLGNELYPNLYRKLLVKCVFKIKSILSII